MPDFESIKSIESTKIPEISPKELAVAQTNLEGKVETGNQEIVGQAELAIKSGEVPKESAGQLMKSITEINQEIVTIADSANKESGAVLGVEAGGAEKKESSVEALRGQYSELKAKMVALDNQPKTENAIAQKKEIDNQLSKILATFKESVGYKKDGENLPKYQDYDEVSSLANNYFGLKIPLVSENMQFYGNEKGSEIVQDGFGKNAKLLAEAQVQLFEMAKKQFAELRKLPPETMKLLASQNSLEIDFFSGRNDFVTKALHGPDITKLIHSDSSFYPKGMKDFSGQEISNTGLQNNLADKKDVIRRVLIDYKIAKEKGLL